MARINPLVGTAVAAVLVLAGTALRGPAADDALRQKALKLNTITGQDAINGKILDLVRDKPGLKDLMAEAVPMAKGQEQPFNYTGAYILARAAHVSKEHEDSLVFYKVCAEQAIKLKSGQKLVQVYDGLISLFMETKKYDEAVRACQQFLEVKGDPRMEQVKPFVMEQMILALAKQEKYDDALRLTEKLIEADDGGWYFVSLKGRVLREQGKNDDAVEAFEETLKKLDGLKPRKGEDGEEKEDKEQFEKRVAGYKTSIRYMLTGVYTDLNKVDKAAGILQDLVKEYPNNSTYHNDLGYIWADHDQNLDESERLIRKALELDREERKKLRDQGVLEPEDDKDNAAYLDSLAWVLFKKKDFAEAKKLLLEAIKSDEGKHVEIFDHLADVHMALGEKKEAIEVWKKGLELENISRRDDARKEEVRKKLAKVEGEVP
jgi:tetratricopeptide (TPR) repeat protein